MVFEQDPAARSTIEVVTTYAGLHAVWSHLIAHKLYNNQLLKTKSAVQHEEKCLLKRAKRNLKDTETR